jgi:hypothetical protein
MLYSLQIGLRDHLLAPCPSVLVDVVLPNDYKQQRRTGADGTARFEVPDSSAIIVEVEGNSSLHSMRTAGLRVDRIMMVYRAPRERSATPALAVMMCCPVSHMSVETGLVVASVNDFEMKKFDNNTVACSACGAVHHWSKADAFLGAGNCGERTPG